MKMLNSGYGLCVKLCEGTRDRALFAKCKHVGEDVVVDTDCPAPFVVATEETDTSWCWGHYFATLKDAVDYLNAET